MASRAAVFAVAIGALAGCARTGFPEGGPVDEAPPAVLVTFPEDRAIDVPTDVQVEIVYDEPLAPGVQAQAQRLIFFNPDRPEVVTNAGGKKIEIQPRAPLEPGTSYSVTVLPGLNDRRNNATREPVRIVFSTGGPVTLTLLKGRVTAGGKPAAGAAVRAFNQDRDFGYRALTDSAGTFELPSVALGSYEVTAWNETNGEEGFQFTLEAGDSVVGEIDRVGSGLDLELDLVLADTSAARLVRAEPLARDGLEVTFNDFLARGQAFDPARAELLALAPDVAPRGVSLDSIPQNAVRGERVPVEEVRSDTLEPRALVLRLSVALADSSAYAVRYSGVQNAAGLTTPEGAPYLLFRTRVVPDSTLGPAPAAADSARAAAAPDSAQAVIPDSAQEAPAMPDTSATEGQSDTSAMQGQPGGPAETPTRCGPQ